MGFTIEAWREQSARRLAELGQRQSAPAGTSLYAAVAAAVVWPILQAGREGEAFGAAVALLSLTTAPGVTRLTGELQRWQGELRDEAGLAAALAVTLPQAPDLAAEVDGVLAALGAWQALDQTERTWLAGALEAEVRKEGTWERLAAALRGDRTALAGPSTGRPTVVGHGDVVIGGDVVGGDKIETITHIHAAPADPQAAAQERARRIYLTQLLRQSEALPLAALGEDEGPDSGPRLDDIYVDLETLTLRPLTEPELEARRQARPSLDERAGTRRMTAQEALQACPRLVLLGEPGAGKTALVRHLLAQAAAFQLGQRPAPPAGLPVGLLPILVQLRDLAPALAAWPETEAQARLAGALSEQAAAPLTHLQAEAFAETLRAVLAQGDCLLVLDGLDEVPASLHARVKQLIQAVLRQFQPARVIVTCRVRAYDGDARLPGFEAHTLAPLDDDRIRAFARQWYAAQAALGRLTAGQAEARAADLIQAVLGADLRELAASPLLLTTMALIHQREIGLPRQRVQLYSLAVDILLRRWQKSKADVLAAYLQDGQRVRAMLERLAYEAQRLRPDDRPAGDLPRGLALTILEEPDYLGQAGLAAEFLDYVDQRAGLLVGRGGSAGRPATYSFPHRTFQEYLAGCHLLSGRDTGRQARDIYAHAGEGDIWNLAARLAAEELRYNVPRGQNQLLDLAYQLCPAGAPATAQARRAVLWAGGMAGLVGRAVIQRDTAGPADGPQYLERLTGSLVGLLDSDLKAAERVEAGRRLAELGDPRPEAVTAAGMVFCRVPAGPFQMGEGSGEHTVTLPDYWVGRSVVSQAQFAEFARAGGYDRDDYWPEAATDGYWPAVFSEAARRRSEPDAGLANQPVVSVTWFEALAFCRWLTECWGGRLPAGCEFSLPSEAEWEKAARGGALILAEPYIQAMPLPVEAPRALVPNPNPRRSYPWGSEFGPEQANTEEAHLGTPSPAGCYPLGRSVYGVDDLSGNVWEWTRTRFDDDTGRSYLYPYDPQDGRETLGQPRRGNRVVRGGSFAYNQVFARCTVRNRHSPLKIGDDHGFRVVMGPARGH